MNRFNLIFIMFVALSGCNGGSSEGESSEPSILENFNISKIAESSTSDEVVIEMPGGSSGGGGVSVKVLRMVVATKGVFDPFTFLDTAHKEVIGIIEAKASKRDCSAYPVGEEGLQGFFVSWETDGKRGLYQVSHLYTQTANTEDGQTTNHTFSILSYEHTK